MGVDYKGIDEFRLKNAIRCQAEIGIAACKYCPYILHKTGDCDRKKIAEDTLSVFQSMDTLFGFMREQINTLAIELEKKELSNHVG